MSEVTQSPMNVHPRELLAFAPPIPDHNTQDPFTQAGYALTAANQLIDAYCRGNHRYRSNDHYKPGIRGVVLTVAARILANPGQVSFRVQSGAVVVSKGVGFSGFTLPEIQTMNRYRKRAI